MIFLISLAFVAADAYFNHVRIEWGERINHYINGAYRTVFYGGLIWAYHLNTLQALMFGLGVFFGSWLLFNLFLNYLQHKPVDYLSTGSILDRFEAKLPWIVWVIWKVIAASGFIYGFYHMELL